MTPGLPARPTCPAGQRVPAAALWPGRLLCLPGDALRKGACSGGFIVTCLAAWLPGCLAAWIPAHTRQQSSLCQRSLLAVRGCRCHLITPAWCPCCSADPTVVPSFWPSRSPGPAGDRRAAQGALLWQAERCAIPAGGATSAGAGGAVGCNGAPDAAVRAQLSCLQGWRVAALHRCCGPGYCLAPTHVAHAACARVATAPLARGLPVAVQI